MILLVGLVIFMTSHKTDLQTEERTEDSNIILPDNDRSTESTSNQTTPDDRRGFREVGEQLSLDNTSGQQILTKDFRDSLDAEQNESFYESYQLTPAEYDSFDIFFYGFSGVFQITLLTENHQLALTEAQNYLVDTLGITRSESCFLKYNVESPGWIDLPYEITQDLRLPSC